MPVADLIPLPVRADLEVPDVTDEDGLKAWFATFVKGYNADRAIMRQNINRLMHVTPEETEAMTAEDVGYVLALLVNKVGGNQPANLAYPPAPVYNPTRVLDFLRHYAFMQ